MPLTVTLDIGGIAVEETVGLRRKGWNGQKRMGRDAEMFEGQRKGRESP